MLTGKLFLSKSLGNKFRIEVLMCNREFVPFPSVSHQKIYSISAIAMVSNYFDTIPSVTKREFAVDCSIQGMYKEM